MLLAAVGVSVGLVVAGTPTPGSGQHQSSTTGAAAARARVISALGATTAAGNWNITYSYTQVPGGNSTTTTTVPPAMTCPTTYPPSSATGNSCAVLVVPGSSAPDDENVTVTGTGVIVVNPKAMVTEADPSNPDGWVNIGRCAVSAGANEAAKTKMARNRQSFIRWIVSLN